MEALTQRLLDFIQFLWPFVRIDAWKRGVHTIFGYTLRDVTVRIPFTGWCLPITRPTCGAGIYGRIPWFTDVHVVSLAWEGATTGRKDITLMDDRTLTFEAEAWYRVTDALAAYTLVHNYENQFREIMAAVLAEKLAEVEAERFHPAKRGRLNTSLHAWVQKEVAAFGIEIEWLRFTTFVITGNPQRILNDSYTVNAHEKDAA